MGRKKTHIFQPCLMTEGYSQSSWRGTTWTGFSARIFEWEPEAPESLPKTNDANLKKPQTQKKTKSASFQSIYSIWCHIAACFLKIDNLVFRSKNCYTIPPFILHHITPFIFIHIEQQTSFFEYYTNQQPKTILIREIFNKSLEYSTIWILPFGYLK